MRNRSVVVWMLLLDTEPGEQANVQNNCTDNVFKRKQAKNTTRLKLLLYSKEHNFGKLFKPRFSGHNQKPKQRVINLVVPKLKTKGFLDHQ